MSTASVVPETWELTGDDARRTLRDTGRLRLVKDAFMRLRFADGFSHARSLAFDHPAAGRRVEFTSPYPEDLAHALDILRRG